MNMPDLETKMAGMVLNIWPLATKYRNQCNHASRAFVLKITVAKKKSEKIHCLAIFFAPACLHSHVSDGWEIFKGRKDK